MGAQDIGKPYTYQQQQTQQGPPQDETTLAQQGDQGYIPMSQPYDAWQGKLHSGLDAQMLDMVLNCRLPDDPKSYREFFEVLINAASSNPNATEQMIRNWIRDMIDVDDRAHSQGRRSIAEAKARKLLFKIRAYVARGDNPMQGLSGVAAAITSFQKQEQTIKMPQPQQQLQQNPLRLLNPANWFR